MNSQDRYKIAETAIGALQKMKSKSSTPIVESNIKHDFSRLVFEDYDDETFNNKVKIDTIFYKSMLKNLHSSYAENVGTIITNMIEVTKQIYEHLNIKPRMYGFHSTSVFNESDDVLEKNALRFINDFINDNYYKLTTEQREKKYLEQVNDIASDTVINEKLDAEDAIKFATKTTVIKDLVSRINFPVVVRDKLEETINDSDYGKIFDQDHLKELYESFQKHCLGFSKIIAAVI